MCCNLKISEKNMIYFIFWIIHNVSMKFHFYPQAYFHMSIYNHVCLNSWLISNAVTIWKFPKCLIHQKHQTNGKNVLLHRMEKTIFSSYSSVSPLYSLLIPSRNLKFPFLNLYSHSQASTCVRRIQFELLHDLRLLFRWQNTFVPKSLEISDVIVFDRNAWIL